MSEELIVSRESYCVGRAHHVMGELLWQEISSCRVSGVCSAFDACVMSTLVP